MRIAHRHFHLRAWAVMAALLPAILLAALLRGQAPPEEPPRRLAAPEARR